MKKKLIASAPGIADDEIPPQHKLDYRRAKPNRFAAKMQETEQMVVLLDADVAKVFKSPAAVNNLLRALIANMPSAQRSKASRK
jgi:hypothetical protein